MENTHHIVERVAELSRLTFTSEETQIFEEQFGKILTYIQTIEHHDLSSVEPLSHIVTNTSSQREDLVTPSLTVDEALANAPKRNETFFKVPKVLQK